MSAYQLWCSRLFHLRDQALGLGMTSTARSLERMIMRAPR